MRRVLPVILAASLIAAATDDKWKQEAGEWKIEKNRITCASVGTLLWTGDVGDEVEIQTHLFIHKWVQGIGPAHLVGICWRYADDGRYQLRICENSVTIWDIRNEKEKSKVLASINFSAPTEKRIPIRLKLSKTGALAMVGRAKMAAKFTITQVGPLALHANGAMVSFVNFRIKS